jgi:hypothetical protein
MKYKVKHVIVASVILFAILFSLSFIPQKSLVSSQTSVPEDQLESVQESSLLSWATGISECGNGAIDFGEICDASAGDGSYGCNSDSFCHPSLCFCVPQHDIFYLLYQCGNGQLEPGEECEFHGQCEQGPAGTTPVCGFNCECLDIQNPGGIPIDRLAENDGTFGPHGPGGEEI